MKTIREPEYTQEELHRLFEYKDGELYWKVSLTRSCKVGSKAGTFDRGCGYFNVSVNRRTYRLHRVVYHYHYNLTNSIIDHIDNDRTNNRVENLRICTQSQNQCNSSRKNNRKHDLPKGVCFDKVRCGRYKPYKAYIKLNGRSKHLGYYETPELAHECYCLAADLAFGEFANHG